MAVSGGPAFEGDMEREWRLGVSFSPKTLESLVAGTLGDPRPQECSGSSETHSLLGDLVPVALLFLVFRFFAMMEESHRMAEHNASVACDC